MIIRAVRAIILEEKQKTVEDLYNQAWDLNVRARAKNKGNPEKHKLSQEKVVRALKNAQKSRGLNPPKRGKKSV